MNRQLIEGKDFYYDEHGYVVFTEAYHLGKGYCCGHGCRHCPFDYESVPEPRRSELLAQKQKATEPKA
jgi:hypothetical protein